MLDEKVEIQLLNAVFPAFVWRNQQFTEKMQDRKSNLHSFISVYKNWDIRPQGLDLGGSTASNEVNMRPRGQFLILKLPDFDD